MKLLTKSILALALAASFCSCYRMPTDDDYNVNPVTNNPSVTREKPSNNLMPKVGY